MFSFRSLSLVWMAALAIALGGCGSTDSANNASTPADNSTAQTTSHGSHGGKRLININTAILSELDKLEGKLGVPALSHKIQAARPYANPEELVSKKIVTQEQFQQIKDLVTVEDIVLTGEAKDIDYAIKLGLMKGHMIVAKELLDLKQPAQAEPHIGHPVEEIYVDVEEQLKERGVAEFKSTLIRVQDFVKSKPNDPQLQAEFDAAMAAIDKAIAALPEKQRKSPAFVLQVINGLLDTASAEYTASISNGKISAAIEYQDSRGFVNYANKDLLPTIQAQLNKDNPQLGQTTKINLENLSKAWPSPIPPAAPVMSADEVAAKVKKIEQSTQAAIAAAAK